MTLYALTATAAILRTSDGATIPPDPDNRDFQAFLDWQAAGNTPTPYAPPTPAPVFTLSPLQFIARFTQAEQTAIVTAAQTNSALMLWLIQCSGASYIDLTDPRTIAGLDQLIAAGLVQASRRVSLLAAT